MQTQANARVWACHFDDLLVAGATWALALGARLGGADRWPRPSSRWSPGPVGPHLPARAAPRRPGGRCWPVSASSWPAAGHSWPGLSAAAPAPFEQARPGQGLRCRCPPGRRAPATPCPASGSRCDPGDSLWRLSQEHLRRGVAPRRRPAVARTYRANRTRHRPRPRPDPTRPTAGPPRATPPIALTSHETSTGDTMTAQITRPCHPVPMASVQGTLALDYGQDVRTHALARPTAGGRRPHRAGGVRPPVRAGRRRGRRRRPRPEPAAALDERAASTPSSNAVRAARRHHPGRPPRPAAAQPGAQRAPVLPLARGGGGQRARPPRRTLARHRRPHRAGLAALVLHGPRSSAESQPAGRAFRSVGPPGAPWHFLYFLPEPQGHRSLRPAVANGSSALLAGLPLTSASPSSLGAE